MIKGNQGTERYGRGYIEAGRMCCREGSERVTNVSDLQLDDRPRLELERC
jgi:hypothetical protein